MEEQLFWKLSHRTVVARKFGLRGQETARIPGAREPERLFLAGWEVNIQSGQEKEHDQIEKGLFNQPAGGGMYYDVVIIILLLLLILL